MKAKLVKESINLLKSKPKDEVRVIAKKRFKEFIKDNKYRPVTSELKEYLKSIIFISNKLDTDPDKLTILRHAPLSDLGNLFSALLVFGINIDANLDGREDTSYSYEIDGNIINIWPEYKIAYMEGNEDTYDTFLIFDYNHLIEKLNAK